MLVPERECEKAGKTLSVCRFALFHLFSHFFDFSVSACFSRLRTRNLQTEKLSNRKDVFSAYASYNRIPKKSKTLLRSVVSKIPRFFFLIKVQLLKVILGFHMTSEMFPFLGIRHVGVPPRVKFTYVHMPSLCNYSKLQRILRKRNMFLQQMSFAVKFHYYLSIAEN